MMHAFKRLLLAAGLFAALALPAAAQQVAAHNLPIGKGPGVVGFGAMAPGTAGQIPVSQGSTSDPAFKAVSGDCTAASTGAWTCTKTNGTAFGTAAVKNTGTSGSTVPLLNTANAWSAVQSFADGDLQLSGSTSGAATLKAPSTGGGALQFHTAGTVLNADSTDTVSNKSLSGSANTFTNLPNSALVNPATTVNGQTCTLGSTCTATAVPSGSAGGDLSGTYPNPTAAKVNGVTYGSSPSTNTVPVITGTNAATYETVPNAALANSSVTIAGHAVSLGASQAIACADLSTATTSCSTANATAATPSTLATRDSSANLSANNFLPGYATTVTAAGTTTLTVGSAELQYFTGTTTQTVQLPVVSTLVLGQAYTVVNNSSGAVAVNSSGANLILSVAAGNTGIFTAISTSGTTAASWSITYISSGAGTGTVSSVTCGTGLSGGTITTSGTCAVNYGSTSTTAAAGNDSRITGALQAANNLSDVGTAATARTNLGLTALATTTPGTGVATALATNVGSAGSVVVNGGALGTPSSGTATNLTGTAASLTAGTATVANGIKSATTTVTCSAATAPSATQVLTATSSTACDWETPSSGVTVVRKTTQQTANSATLANDNALLFTVSASTNYVFYFFIPITNSTSTNAGGAQVAVTTPSGTISYGVMINESDGATVGASTASSGTGIGLTGAISTTMIAVVTGSVQVGVTGGTLQLQFAQNTAVSAHVSTFKVGAYGTLQASP